MGVKRRGGGVVLERALQFCASSKSSGRFFFCVSDEVHLLFARIVCQFFSLESTPDNPANRTLIIRIEKPPSLHSSLGELLCFVQGSFTAYFLDFFFSWFLPSMRSSSVKEELFFVQGGFGFARAINSLLFPTNHKNSTSTGRFLTYVHILFVVCTIFK